MDKAEPVADDDQRQLILELGLLEEVLDLLGVVVVRLSADPLDLSDLASPRGSLDVLELDFGVGAQVDDGTEVVVEACIGTSQDQWGALYRGKTAYDFDHAPSKVLKDSKSSMRRTGPMSSEYLVAAWTTTCRFWRMLTLSISLKHSRVFSTVSLPK